MNRSVVNKKYKQNRENFDTLTHQPGRWLRRLGLWELVVEMASLSMEYKLAWVASWAEHLDDPAWLRRAMANTWARLSDADREKVRDGYEDWKWYEQRLDLKYLVAPEFWAECYILDGERKRVYWDGRFVTCCRVLKGQTAEEALSKLESNSLEFVRWI